MMECKGDIRTYLKVLVYGIRMVAPLNRMMLCGEAFETAKRLRLQILAEQAVYIKCITVANGPWFELSVEFRSGFYFTFRDTA